MIQEIEDLKWFLGAALLVLGPFVLPAMLESVSGTNFFGIMGGLSATGYGTRHGRYRSFASFQHPSLMGTVGASFFPLYIWLLLRAETRRIAILGIVVCLLIVIASNSGGPMSCLGCGLVGWLLWPVRTKMKMVRRSLVAGLVLIGFSMKATIWYLPARLSDFTGGDGYHRSYLMDIAFQNLGSWLLIGMPLIDTANWFPTHLDSGAADITNQFLSFGITAGIFAMILFIVLLVKVYKRLGAAMAVLRSNSSGSAKEAELVLWALGVVLLVHIFNFIGITYFDQTYAIWFLELAVMATFSEKILQSAMGNTGETSSDSDSQIYPADLRETRLL